jgi:putative endonuclease
VTRRALGRAGEEAAVAALRERGYRILDRNVRLRRGELDVVALERGTIVFVEVKARRSARYGTPADAVTPRKRGALVRLAAAYLTTRAWTGRACRFDVAEVWLDAAGRVQRVEIIPDAFQA